MFDERIGTHVRTTLSWRFGSEIGPEDRDDDPDVPGVDGTDIGPEDGGQFVPGEGPFGGSTTGGGGDSRNISITFDPSRSEKVTPCERIQFIQTCQILVDGVAVDPGDFFAGWEYRDNTALEDDPATEADETGTFVDHLEGATAPYYPGAVPGSSNGTNSPATMGDQPCAPNGWFAPGGFDATGPPSGNDFDADEIKFRFETCAYCECGDDAGEFFECLIWEYTRTRADVAAGNLGRSTILSVTSGPSATLVRAFERWCSSNNFDPSQDCE